jgi:hypothetical protein
MLDHYMKLGQADALRRFGLTKLAMDLGPSGVPAAAPAAPMAAPAAPGGGFLDKAKAFGMGQLGHAKSLAGNLHQGLGGAATPELGAAARQGALGNLKGLAPSLVAGGALYMMHRHNEAERQRQQQMAQQQMMPGGY